MYKYQDLRPSIFTEDGQVAFIKIRDHVKAMIESAGAVTMGSAMNASTGDSWTLMACVDRLVELGEIREIPQQDVMGQHRVFVGSYK